MPASITPPDTFRPVRRGTVPLPVAVRPGGERRATGSAWAKRTSRADRVVRRGLDIVVASLALAALAPLFVVIGVLIKLSSPGPVLYQQVRVGVNRRFFARGPRHASSPRDRRIADRRQALGHGRPFRIYKFRTMVPNAEEYGPQWSRRDDPRIFPFGRFLRVSRLDETPQFLNVLLGDMSLVGPRPERPYFVDRFVETIPNYTERLEIPPGITGRAQVRLDYDASVDDVKRKVEQDLHYIRNRSLRADVAILLRTVWVVLTGRGAC